MYPGLFLGFVLKKEQRLFWTAVLVSGSIVPDSRLGNVVFGTVPIPVVSLRVQIEIIIQHDPCYVHPLCDIANILNKLKKLDLGVP